MSLYGFPIRAAFALFPLLALLLTLPYLLYSYRKYGAVSPLRSLILFSFLLYLMCAYFLVVLPLPDPASVAGEKGPFVQLHPFVFLRTFLQNSPFILHNPRTYLPALASPEFREPLLNVLLTLPFGIYLSYYFRENLPKTVLTTFLLSLFFELSQLTGLYGLYPKPYRLFSIDDLMLNTLGGFLGYYLGTEAAAILPSKRNMDRQSFLRSRRVGYIRRLAADAADAPLFFFLLEAAAALLGSGKELFPILFMLYFAGLPSLTKGATPGKMLVRTRIVLTGDNRNLPLRLFIRYGLVAVTYLPARQSLAILHSDPTREWRIAAMAAGVFLILLYGISWAAGFFRDKRLWYEFLSGTKIVSTFTPEKEKPE